MAVFRYTLEELEQQLADLCQEERQAQESLAAMMDPNYTSKDGLFEGQTFSGAREVFISAHIQDLEGIAGSINITKERIEKAKRNKRKIWSGP